jgi:predicted transcriptional regulator
MGGDRVCPDDCPLAVWASLPPNDRKAQRKPIAERLYKQGFTMEQIATQLGVNQSTITRDLKDIYAERINVEDRGTDTRGRKKSSGRPKGRRRSKPRQTDPVKDKIEALADQGVSSNEIANELGVAGRAVRHELERQRERREGQSDPEIDPSTLSLTAQQKLDAAIRQHKRRFDLEFDVRVRAEMKRLLDEVALPAYAKEIANLERSIRDRRGIMDRATYRKILACLHVERLIQLLNISITELDPALKKRFNEAFTLFTELEKRVLNEKESPTTFRPMPRTYEDLMRMKAKVKAERAAKRAAKTAVDVR